LAWKKSTEEESLTNLRQIYKFIIQESNWVNLNKKIALVFGLDITNNRFQNLSQIFRQNKLKNYLKSATNYWEEVLKEFLTSQNMDFGATLWPLRLALSGREKSPSPFELLSVLELNQAKERIQKYLN
jgi:hypothetical protein